MQKDIDYLRACFWGFEYKFKTEKEAILFFVDESIKDLENKRYEKVKEYLYLIKFGGYKLDEWAFKRSYFKQYKWRRPFL